MALRLIGSLTIVEGEAAAALLDEPLRAAFRALGPTGGVVEIDAAFSDTAAFCDRYGVPPAVSANCVVVAARRADRRTLVACVAAATTRVDVNGVVKKLLDARKISFAPVDEVTETTGMQYGGVTPLGLPADWRVLLDERVAALPLALVGGGRRDRKVVAAGAAFAALPNVEVLDIALPRDEGAA